MEVLHIDMLALDQDLVIGALQIVSPLIQCFDDCYKLLIILVIVLFRQGALVRVDIDLSKQTESVILVKHAGNCDASCISLQNDQFLQVEMLQDQCVCEGHFVLSKCEISIPSPFPLP